MNLKYTKILSTVLLCSTLSNTYAASDDYVDAYTPGTSSKVGLLKAGLMGIGLMSMASPVEAQNTVYIVKKPFFMKECYIGRMDRENVKPYNNITITQIMDVSFGFSDKQYQLRDISLKFSGVFTDYSFNDHTLDACFDKAYLCSMVFKGSLPAKFKFNYENNNCDECFSMITYSMKITGNDYYDVNLFNIINPPAPPPTVYYPTPYSGPVKNPIRTNFEDVLKYVIDNGSCPPPPTLWPTIQIPTSSMPTSSPTSPTKKPTDKPTTGKPTLRPTTGEPTTTPTTLTPSLRPTQLPSQMVPTPRPHHSFPTRPTRPWPPFFPTPWIPADNS